MKVFSEECLARLFPYVFLLRSTTTTGICTSWTGDFPSFRACVRLRIYKGRKKTSRTCFHHGNFRVYEFLDLQVTLGEIYTNSNNFPNYVLKIWTWKRSFRLNIPNNRKFFTTDKKESNVWASSNKCFILYIYFSIFIDLWL